MKKVAHTRCRFTVALGLFMVSLLQVLMPAGALPPDLSHLFNQSGSQKTIRQGDPAAAAKATGHLGAPAQTHVQPQIALSYQANRRALPGDSTPLPQPGTINSSMQSQFGIRMTNGDAGWTEAQAQAAFRVLSSLPPSFRSATKYIKRVRGSGGILGYVYLGNPTVNMCTRSVRPVTFQETLVHEMVHTFQAENPNVLRMFRQTFWPNNRMRGRSVSSYGCTESIEDMAECGRAYWSKGALMKRYYPSRYEFMKRYVFNGVEYP
jgi:hypothetical protein